MQPNDDDDKHNADEDHDDSLEPLFAILWAETHLGQIPHEITASRELLTYSGADGIITERGICHEYRGDSAEREVCDGEVAIKSNI